VSPRARKSRVVLPNRRLQPAAAGAIMGLRG
jgi:hypothetical protein